ncbi:hypothetical protein ACFY78_27995 [Streptomyces olindensis]|uniref:hypothetical protein n=1 Tax=Streptomyces olindensis TaxID=358823 RepID=UPI00367E3B6A
MTYRATRGTLQISAFIEETEPGVKVEKTATDEAVAASGPAPEELLYSAEVRHANGKCTLTISDHLHGGVEVYVVPKAALKKLPFYLAMLRNKLS